MLSLDAIYPSVPHEAGLKALKDALDNKEDKSLSTRDLIQIAHFVLQTNFLNSMGFSETLKYWVGVQRGQSYLMGRRCLFSLSWPPF